MKKLLKISLAFAFIACISLIQAATAQTMDESQPRAKHTQTEAFLGVNIDQMPPALSAQLRNLVANGQGVVVTHVLPDSPASNAGIQDFDVLIAYEDQKLFSPDQLTKLVRSDKHGRSVRMDIVRNGKQQSVTVTLGQRRARVMRHKPGFMPWMWRGQPHHFMMPPSESRLQGEHSWERFDSLSLKKLEGNRYRAEIEYLEEDGNKRHHVFEGTREAIREQILQQEELPNDKRRLLLNALNMGFGPFGPAFWGPLSFDDLKHQWNSWNPAF